MKRKLHLQFSLKGFLLVLTGSCIIVGNWASRVHRQRDAVDAMLRAGCRVTYDFNPDTSDIKDAIRLIGFTPRPFWFDVLHSPTGVVISHHAGCVQALTHIGDAPTISDIDIYAALTKNELALLQTWRNPRYLGIWNVTDAEFAHLPDLQGLRILCLDLTDITDSSIQVITKLPTLRLFSVLRTRLTKRGVAAIEAALPRCHVSWSAPPVRLIR